MSEHWSSDAHQHSVATAEHCQEEILKCLNALMMLNETTGMENWSDDLRQNYRRAVDSLSAIQVHLHLLKAAQRDNGDGATTS
jgi:hypothetical protein